MRASQARFDNDDVLAVVVAPWRGVEVREGGE
jgi:hypothetical protein